MGCFKMFGTQISNENKNAKPYQHTCSTSKIIKNLIRNQTTCKYGLFLFLQKLMKLNYGFNKKNHDVVRAAVS